MRKAFIPLSFGLAALALFMVLECEGVSESAQIAPPVHSYSFASFKVKNQAGQERTVKAHVVKATLGNNMYLFPYLVPNKILKTVDEVASNLDRQRPNKIIAVINAGFFGETQPGRAATNLSSLRDADAVNAVNLNDFSAEQLARHQRRSALHLELALRSQKPRVIQNASLRLTTDTNFPKQQWYITGGGQLLPNLASTYGTAVVDAPDPGHRDKSSRTAIGWASAAANQIALVTVPDSHPVTIPELQQLMKQIQVENRAIDTAMAFDGSRSTSLWYKGEMKCFHPVPDSPRGRPVMTMLVLKVHFF